MAKKDSPQIPRLRAINPADWIRLLWWGLVAPENLKLHQKQHGKNAHKRTAGFIMSTLLWSPMFIVMSATAINPNLITRPNIFRATPVILAGVIFVLWGITWALITSLEKNKEDASYSPNNILPLGVSFLSAYIALEGMLGGWRGAVLMVIIGIITVTICDVLGENIKVNSESIIALGLLTGAIYLGISALLGGRYGVPVITSRPEDINPIGLVIGGVAILIALLGVWLVSAGLESFIKNLHFGGKVIFWLIPILLGILIWLYYLGGWMNFSY
ncbi:MAG: hypothetical protein SFZ02_08540 [bacterium]|nr:hypothetical protein [bacterium]